MTTRLWHWDLVEPPAAAAAGAAAGRPVGRYVAAMGATLERGRGALALVGPGPEAAPALAAARLFGPEQPVLAFSADLLAGGRALLAASLKEGLAGQALAPRQVAARPGRIGVRTGVSMDPRWTSLPSVPLDRAQHL